MQTPNTVTLWLSNQARPLVLIAVLMALMFVLLSLSMSRRRAARAGRHTEEDQDEFVTYLTQYGFDATIASTTCRYLQARIRSSFPLRADDLLRQELGLSRTEVREAVEDLMRINGRWLHREAVTPDVLTVEDLIRAVQAAPRLDVVAA